MKLNKQVHRNKVIEPSHCINLFFHERDYNLINNSFSLFSIDYQDIYTIIHLKINAANSTSTDRLRRTVRTANRDLDRDGSARTGSSAATTRHETRSGASPATSVAVGPAVAEASDRARAVAHRAMGRAHHGPLVHQRLHQRRPGQHAQAGY